MAAKDRIHGLFEGYGLYRYGPKNVKPVSLSRIFKGEKKKHVAASVLDAMRDWRQTPFEAEGPTRAGVRSALCLQGHGWARADFEAELLTADALRVLGAERPSWEEGQHQFSDSPDRCSWCHGPIEDDDRTNGQRFCSTGCASRSLEYRVTSITKEHDSARKAAHRLIARSKVEPKQCAGCGKPFRRSIEDQRFCSNACGQANKVVVNPWYKQTYERACQECNATFQASSPIAKFCCKAHQSKFFRWRHRQSERRDLASERLPCGHCGTQFTPQQTRAKYCSNRCASIMGKRAGYARKRMAAKQSNVIYLTAEIFDGWFQRAA